MRCSRVNSSEQIRSHFTAHVDVAYSFVVNVKKFDSKIIGSLFTTVSFLFYRTIKIEMANNMLLASNFKVRLFRINKHTLAFSIFVSTIKTLYNFIDRNRLIRNGKTETKIKRKKVLMQLFSFCNFFYFVFLVVVVVQLILLL